MGQYIIPLLTFLGGVGTVFLPKFFEFQLEKRTAESQDFKYIIEELKKDNETLRARINNMEIKITELTAQSLRDQEEISSLRQELMTKQSKK